MTRLRSAGVERVGLQALTGRGWIETLNERIGRQLGSGVDSWQCDRENRPAGVGTGNRELAAAAQRPGRVDHVDIGSNARSSQQFACDVRMTCVLPISGWHACDGQSVVSSDPIGPAIGGALAEAAVDHADEPGMPVSGQHALSRCSWRGVPITTRCWLRAAGTVCSGTARSSVTRRPSCCAASASRWTSLPWREPSTAFQAIRPLSRMLTASGRKTGWLVAVAAARRSAMAQAGSGLGWPGCDMMRMQPFSVSGHNAQPD